MKTETLTVEITTEYTVEVPQGMDPVDARSTLLFHLSQLEGERTTLDPAEDVFGVEHIVEVERCASWEAK